MIVLFAALAGGLLFLRTGWEKVHDPAWTGAHAGLALQGFLKGATVKATLSAQNPHPNVLPAVNAVNQGFIAQHAALFGGLVVLGELLVPVGVIALLCLRFPGSRTALIGLAALAAGLNLLYLHEGSAGLNPPMLVLWLTVLGMAVLAPAAVQAHAIDLARLVRRAAAPPVSDAAAVPGQWLVVAAVLIGLVVESLLLYDAATVVVIGVAALAVAGVLRTLDRGLTAVTAHEARGERGVRRSGPRVDTGVPGLER